MKPRDKKLIVGVVSIILVLLAVRIALPSVVKRYVNQTLHAMQAYDGSVSDIDLQLWRGAYRIDGLQIVKRGGDSPLPFFNSDAINLSVEWRSLFKGSVVAEAEFIHPELNLVQSDNKARQQMGNEQNWVDKLRELAPMRFNTVRVSDGKATFRVPGIKVPDALEATAISGQITNLTNVVEQNKETFSNFDINGRVLNDAPLQIAGSVNPFAARPTFDVNLKLEKVSLPRVNPWLSQFIKADAESGQFELYIEMAAAEGRFKGYAKPLMQNVEIARSNEDEASVFRKAWESIVDAAFKVLENDEEQQVAARIPFSGSVENPDAGVFATIVSVLRNAFVSAFSRSLEGSISLHDVKKTLKKARDEPKDKNDSTPGK